MKFEKITSSVQYLPNLILDSITLLLKKCFSKTFAKTYLKSIFWWVAARSFDSLEPSWNESIKFMDAILWYSRPNFINTLNKIIYIYRGTSCIIAEVVLDE